MKTRLFSFKGGIHPDYCKEFTREKSIEHAEVPEVVEISLSQHIGAPAVPAVSKGDYVKLGQPIGKAGGFVSANIHSSVSGQVTAIEDRYQNGAKVKVVVIQNDGKDEAYEGLKGHKSLDGLSPEDIKGIVQDAGIVGMGGATFPTHVKLNPPKEHTVDTVIINGAECEGYLTSDHRLMLERPGDVVFGVKAILKAINVKKAYVAIENNKPDAIKAITDAAKSVSEIEVVSLETKYPQGGEKQLIKAVTGREVPSKKLPSEVGCAVFNVGTTAAIARAIREGIPLIERVVTISGMGVKEPRNLLVRIGTPFRKIVEQCGGLKESYAKVISGGPMMGIAQNSLDVSVMKGTSGVLVLTESEVAEFRPYPCIKCGRCIDVCPMGLMPVKLANAVEAGDLDAARKANIMDCIECGCCSFICPAKRQLLQTIRLGKARIRSQKN